MGTKATALTKLVIDLKCLVLIFSQNAAIWTVVVAVLAEAAGATSKTTLGLLDGLFLGKIQVDLFE